MTPPNMSPSRALRPLPHAGSGSSRESAAAAIGCKNAGNVRWTYARARAVIRGMAFGLRNHPGQLANLTAEVQGDLEPAAAALPAFDLSVARACIEDADVLRAAAVYHESMSTEDLEKLRREMLESIGASILCARVIKAQIDLRRAK